MSSFSRASENGNPRTWRFTWEAVACVPTLRLFLFNPIIKPLHHCKDLKVTLQESLVIVSWAEQVQDQKGTVYSSLRVPLPKVLVDPSSAVGFKATEDHVEVKLVLLLPVDHPVVANLDSMLNLSQDSSAQENLCSDRLQPLSIDYDIERLSSSEGVHLYCRSCSAQLTKELLTSFKEMPSVDWRDVADNWFGACCCSFGGASEKLVAQYASLYSCTEGTCLVDVASIIVCKSDLIGYVSPDHSEGSSSQESGLGLDGMKDFPETVIGDGNICGQGLYYESQAERASDVCKELSSLSLKEECSGANLELDVAKKGQINYCKDKPSYLSHDLECCLHSISATSSNAEDQQSIKNGDLMRNQKLLLNGFLGNGFMMRSSHLSKDVKWIEFRCISCSCLLGAYPSISCDDAPLDGGIRLFKCHISTGLPVDGSGNIFRNNTFERMFTYQLVESATNELSFRTVVRDLKKNTPALRVVLLNLDAWCYTGNCVEAVGCIGPTNKVELLPVIKVLFSICVDSTEDQSRIIKEWVAKNQGDEVYMFDHQLKEVTESLKSGQECFPYSCSLLQDFSLSFIER